MEKFFIVLIVALAGWYIVRRFWKDSKEDMRCNCGCASCNIDTTCRDPKKDKAREF